MNSNIKDAIQLILSDLPATIIYQGCTFQLEMIHNGSEMRLSYGLFMVAEDSQHYTMYQGFGCWNNDLLMASGEDYACDFLFLRESIETVPEFEEAVKQAIDFLEKKGLKPTML